MTESHDSDKEAWRKRFASFEGVATDAAAELDATISRFFWASDDPKPNARLLRHYVQSGALDKPERRGKEAFYRERQLVQYLALRWLINDGWPLSKAAVETSTRDTDELVSLIPTTDDADGSRAAADRLASGPTSDAQLARSAGRARLSRALALLDAAGPSPEARDTLRISVTGWCELILDRDRIDSLTEPQIRALADAITELVIDARLSKPADKK